MPIPVMMRYMLTGRNAYRGILEGSMSAITGVSLLFLAFWSMTGLSYLQALKNAMKQVNFENMQLPSYYAMGIKELEPASMQLAMDKMKEITALAVPGIIIIFCIIFAYLNYAVISRVLSKIGKKKVSLLPPFRAFTLPKNIVLGSLLIYLLSYITISMGIITEDLIMFNLEMLFTFIFSIQGLAAVFYFGYRKRVPKVVLLLFSVIFFTTWIGQTFLFLLGLTDLVFDLRKRFSKLV
jgi:uncharacterized protein YybS (DUF2232 family)